MTFIISILFSLVIGILIYSIVEPMMSGVKTAKDGAVAKASTSLSDMFLFIDLDKLIRIAFVLIFIMTMVVYTITGSVVLPVVLAVVISFFPKIIIAILKKRRREQILTQIPDLLLNTSSALSAGSGLTQALELSADEQGGAIGQEFGLFLSELRLGVDMEDALDNLSDRVTIPEMDLVVSAIKISREVGGNLGDVLRRLSDTLRKKLEMENKIKTLTAQGRMQGIVMVCLPIFIGIALFFMESTGPYIVHLFTRWYGWVTLGVLFIMLTTGYFFIRKIVNIDV